MAVRLGTFCALSPLEDEDAARSALRSWGESPFARLPSVHFARFVVVPRPERQVARQPAEEVGGTLLMFSAFFDGATGPFLEALCDALPDEADAVWRCCAGWPGHPRERRHAVVRWLEEHGVAPAQVFAAHPGPTVAEIRAALAFREELRHFVFAQEERRREHAAAFAAFDAGRRR